MVVAVADNGIIGAEGAMPWRLSTDLRRFKALTMGGVMVMGRRTFDAIGRPLPGRRTVVVTRDRTWRQEGVDVAHDIAAALDLACDLAAQMNGRVHIVGGGQIYAASLDRVDEAHVTHVHARPNGDTMFAPLDPREWVETHREDVPAGPQDTVATTYAVYRRRR